MNEKFALTSTPGVTARLMMSCLWLMLIALLAWAWFARLEIAVYGIGNVVPSGQLQVVQNLEGGIVSDILVKQGELVNEDRILMRIDPTDFSARLEDTSGAYAASVIKSVRLTAELEEGVFLPPIEFAARYPEILKKEEELFLARKLHHAAVLAALDTRIEQKRLAVDEMLTRVDFEKKELALLTREYELNKPLAERKVISEGEFLRIEQSRLTASKALEISTLAVATLRVELEEAQASRTEVETGIKAEILAELNENEVLQASLNQELLAHTDKVFRRDVRSPVNGVVNRVLVNTLGGVIRPGDSLVEIVPFSEDLQIRVLISPRDIGFLRADQPAIVRFTAYDSGIYGFLEGKVIRIGADTLSDEKGNRLYEVIVQTSRSYLGDEEGQLPIIPGMQAEVHMVTGERSVLDYILKPIEQVRDTALRER